MYYSQKIINEIISKSDIKTIIEESISNGQTNTANAKLKNYKGIYFSNCPLHSTRTYELLVDTNQQTYHCFRCGSGGNVIDFVMSFKGCDFVAAVKYLAKRAAILIPKENIINTEDEQKKQLILSKINQEAARYYIYEMRKPNGADARKYFAVERQLSKETLNKFGLGYAGAYGDNLYKYLSSLGYEDEVITESGLVGISDAGQNKYYDKFWDRVMFPILDTDGNVIALGGRVLNDGKPKYLNSPETSIFEKGKNLYAFNYAKNSTRKGLILAEGYMDVIAMHQAGFDNAVASLGTALTIHQAKLIANQTDVVYVAYDEDLPGINATIKAIHTLEAECVTVKVVNVRPSKDPDEHIKTYGKASFEQRITDAENSDHFLFRTLKQQTPERDKYFDTASEMLLKFL